MRTFFNAKAQRRKEGGAVVSQKSNFVATGKEFVPIAAKRGTQPHERWQAWKILPGFDVLNVARTHANFFGKPFLSQIPPCSQ